jgi:hypothetical protein
MWGAGGIARPPCASRNRLFGGQTYMRQVVLLAVLGLTGCYSYLPLDTPNPAQGREVSVDITSAGADSLARMLGPGVRAISGRVIEASDSGLMLAVTSTRDRSDFEAPWKGERVTIPRGMMDRVRERRFSVGRSALLGGAIVGAGVGAAVAFSGGGAGGISPGGSSQTPQ